jgi:alcohol dehydrogenase class IV
VHVSHGAGNGLLLPYVMRYNAASREEAIAQIGWRLGANPTSADGTRVMARQAIAEIEKLRADIGIPTRLRDIGVKEEMLPGFAEKAFAIKRLMRVNPRVPQSTDEILEIYKAAY